MIGITGTVQNGVVVLDQPEYLPEGSRVVVQPFESIRTADVKPQTSDNVAETQLAVMVQEGMVTGVLQESSVHEREFELHPPIANYAIICHFPQSMLPKVRLAIQRNVTVRGSMHYYADQPFPKLVKVTSLEIHPCDDDLPTLAALRGLAPGSTGDLSAVDFVRSYRDD